MKLCVSHKTEISRASVYIVETMHFDKISCIKGLRMAPRETWLSENFGLTDLAEVFCMIKSQSHFPFFFQSQLSFQFFWVWISESWLSGVQVFRVIKDTSYIYQTQLQGKYN